MKRIVIIGATSTIAKHCARLWIQDRPMDLTLVGRDTQRTERIATDLKVRSPQSNIQTIQAEFTDPAEISVTVSKIIASGNVDIVLIAHGSLPDQKVCQNNLKICHDTLNINGISPVLYAEAFAKHMEKINQGTIALISSVAGDRGRKSNYTYGAAKGLVSHYTQGLQHRFSRTQVNIILIKPGPTDTPMTASLKNKGIKTASAESVAMHIVNGIKSKNHVIYTPKKWWLIMMIIKLMPSFIFNKLDI